MATIGLGYAGQAIGTAYGGPVGGKVLGAIGTAIGSYIDNKWLFPTLLGDESTPEPRRLLDLPVGANSEGAPRIWAIGRRVRIPAHVMWQTSKEREIVANRNKDGTGVPQRQVIFDFALALNDRPTRGITQFVGNGKLLTWNTRNLVSVTTSEMAVSVASGRLVLAMNTALDPDFGDRFEVNDRILLEGFRMTAGQNVNGPIWAVHSVTKHGTTPSRMELTPIDGQSVAGVVADAGTIFDPATIYRADDRFCDNTLAFTIFAPPITPAFRSWTIRRTSGIGQPFNRVFRNGEWIRLTNWGARSGLWRVFSASEDLIQLYGQGNPQNSSTVFSGTSASDQGRLEPENFYEFASEVLSNSGRFYPGSESQNPDSWIEADVGAGDVPAFRGLSYSVYQKFNSSIFGNSLPAACEVLIDPDQAMTWRDALTEVVTRCGVPREAIDASGVNTRPFEGYYIRGATPVVQAIEPLLMAGGILGQERDGTIALFELETAEIVQIANGSEYSDLGAFQGSGPAPTDAKAKWSRLSVDKIATSYGVRHQDPDNQYVEGYQHHGIRNTNAGQAEVRRELLASNLVLTRKAARNLAAELIRREWVNSKVVQLSLPAPYIHLLENDLLTWTEDTGEQPLVRVIRRDVGANYLVQVTAVREEIAGKITGSPVQSAAGGNRPPLPGAAPVIGVVLDMPAVTNAHGQAPGLLMAACSEDGQRWAGCTVFESRDYGANWNRVASLSMEAAIGTTSLAAGPAAETHGSPTLTIDPQAVDVELAAQGPLQGLYSCSQAEAITGTNWCAIVDSVTGDIEIAAFLDVLQVNATTYTLSNWLRGLRGTKTIEKAGGSRFVLLHPIQLASEFLPHTGPGGPQVLTYRFVPPGASLETVPDVELTARWRNASPLLVRDVTKTIDGSNNARIRFAHWTRQVLPLGNTGPYALDETHEEYRVELWDPTGTAIRRTRTVSARQSGSPALRDRWVDFTSAELSAAGYTPGPSVSLWLNVVQIGDHGEGPANLRLL
jgi:hypothetical protein